MGIIAVAILVFYFLLNEPQNVPTVIGVTPSKVLPGETTKVTTNIPVFDNLNQTEIFVGGQKVQILEIQSSTEAIILIPSLEPGIKKVSYQKIYINQGEEICDPKTNSLSIESEFEILRANGCLVPIFVGWIGED